MSRRVLGVFVALCALFSVSPSTLAGQSATSAAAPKQTANKSSTAKKAAASRKTASQQASKKKAASSKVARKKSQAARAAKSAAGRRGGQTARVVPNRLPATVPAVAPALSAGEQAGLHRTRDPLDLKSSVALVVDQGTAQVLFEKNADIALPIASITKLMTALVVIEARQDLDEVLEISADDIDREKNSASRLRVGAQMTRAEMLHLALMSSENRAASALGRHYPGGLPAFVATMNARAKALGMHDTRFVDPTGLSSKNVASAQDLSKLALATYRYPLIREYSTHERYAVDAGGHQLQYMNSNRLVRHPDWDIGLQKTGYISEAGRCLLMQTRINDRPVVMIFLDSRGKDSRLGDAGRIRKWLETSNQPIIVTHVSAQRS